MMKLTIILVCILVCIPPNRAGGFWEVDQSSSPFDVKDGVLKTALTFCKAAMTGFKIPSHTKNNKKNLCESKSVLDPLVDLFVDQTRNGGAGSTYQENLAELARQFVNQITLEDILSGSNNDALFESMTRNLPDLAAQAFAETKIKEEIRSSYKRLMKTVTLEQLLNLLIGGNTNPLFATNARAVKAAFKNNEELQNLLDTYDNIQASYNNGKSEIWTTLLQILTDNGFYGTSF